MGRACVGCLGAIIALVIALYSVEVWGHKDPKTPDDEVFWKKVSCPKAGDLSRVLVHLQHTDGRRRQLGLACLRRFSDPAVFLPIVSQLLGDPAWRIRYAAADTLIWASRHNALPVFLMALRRKRWQVLHSALYGVGRLRQPWAVSRSFFKRMIGHKRWQVQMSALFALSRSRTKDPILAQMIRPLLTSRRGLVRLNALRAFARLSKDDSAVNAAFLAGLTDRQKRVQVRAAMLLTRQGASAAPLLPKLRALLPKLPRPLPQILTKAIKAIEKASRTP